MIALCIVCIALSTAVTALFVTNWAVSLKNNSSGFLSKKKLIKPFHLMVIGVFLAITILFVPIYLNNLDPSSPWATYVKTPFLAAQNALQLFTLDAGFDVVRDTINSVHGISQNLADIYTVFVAFYFVIAPLLTAAVILSFVQGLYENWRYVRKRKTKKIYIMSELNEYSLALAQNILKTFATRDEDALTAEEERDYLDVVPPTTDNGSKVSRTLIFANVTQKFQEDNEDLVAHAKSLGAICLQKDITEIGLKSPKKDIYRKLYLISDNEEVNTTKALQLIPICHEKYNSSKTHVYIFANSDESGILVDATVSDISKNNTNAFDIKVRRVNEKRNLIWNTLLKSKADLDLQPCDDSNKPLIFETANVVGKKKQINVLSVGFGNYGIELLRTISWFAQMPGYDVNVHVLDREANSEDKIRAIAPGLVEYNKAKYNYYRMDFCNDAIDVNGATFIDKIKELSGITLAFVALGTDRMNIDASIKLRRIFGKYYDADKIPPILTVVYSAETTKNLDGGKLLRSDDGQEDFGIRFIGDTDTRYSIPNVEQSRLERIGQLCHLQWALSSTTQEQWEQAKKAYNVYEYNRRSSMAQAMHLVARKELSDELRSFDRKQIAVNEHNRWNIYMRSEGYTLPLDGRRNSISKLHPLLVDFDKLPPSEQRKDDIEWVDRVQLINAKEMEFNK